MYIEKTQTSRPAEGKLFKAFNWIVMGSLLFAIAAMASILPVT